MSKTKLNYRNAVRYRKCVNTNYLCTFVHNKIISNPVTPQGNRNCLNIAV